MKVRMILAAIALAATQVLAGPDTLPSMPIFIPINIIRIIFGF